MSFLRAECGNEREREPLLPCHNQDTRLQASVEDKLRSFQIMKALSDGYMPSNDQLLAHLRHTINILRTAPVDTSSTGKELIRNFRQHLKHLAAFFENKNGSDQIQDFLWYVTKARFTINSDDLEERARAIRPRADIATGEYRLPTL